MQEDVCQLTLRQEENKEYVISYRTPCYICYNKNCMYYICGECYKQELVNGSTNGRSSIWNKLNNSLFIIQTILYGNTCQLYILFSKQMKGQQHKFKNDTYYFSAVLSLISTNKKQA